MVQTDSVHSTGAVTLREVTVETVRRICDLRVSDEQQRFVAPNAVSIAEAHFSDNAWFRAVYADEEPVGFLMLYDDPVTPEYELWRLMIDHRYQRFGFGREAVRRLIEHVRTRPGASELQLSVVQDAGGPQPFYERLGFVLTGEMQHGEAIMKLDLRNRSR